MDVLYGVLCVLEDLSAPTTALAVALILLVMVLLVYLVYYKDGNFSLPVNNRYFAGGAKSAISAWQKWEPKWALRRIKK